MQWLTVAMIDAMVEESVSQKMFRPKRGTIHAKKRYSTCQKEVQYRPKKRSSKVTLWYHSYQASLAKVRRVLSSLTFTCQINRYRYIHIIPV